jgi:hypothetical protein
MLAVFAVSVSSASANVPGFSIRSVAVPTNLPPGGTGEIVVIATNLGGARANGSTDPIVIRDELPAGVQATSVTETTWLLGAGFSCGVVPGGSAVSCEASGELAPSELAMVHIHVSVAQTVGASPAVNSFSIAGGEAEPASGSAALHLSSAPVAFGVESLEQVALNEDGSPDTQAGSHPFGFTTTLQLNEIFEPGNDSNPVPATVRDLHFDLPPGLIGNPTVNPQCTFEQFSTQVEEAGREADKGVDRCPDDTAVGVVTVWFGFGAMATVPVFNLTPSVGEPARFAFNVLGTPVFLNTAIRSGGDYSVEVGVDNIDTVLPVSATQLTFWGAPADPGHDEARGWNCLYHGAGTNGLLGPCPQSRSGGATAPPFLTLPTSCTGPLRSTVEADSWQHPGEFVPGEYTSHDNAGPLGLTGCDSLRFEPSVKVTPDGTAASTPTGLTVDEHVAQDSTLDPTGLAESDVKGLSVTLPEGVALNPAAADGLLACSEEQIALHSGEAPGCPDSSKVATVKIKTPLLPEPLEGFAYLASPQNFLGPLSENPFRSLLAMYIYAEDPTAGVRVKAAGEVLENPLTGQLTAHFEHDPAFEGDSQASQFLPQLPFEDLEVHFLPGERAPLATPAYCSATPAHPGPYKTEATFTPWSAPPGGTSSSASESSSTFDITSGPKGSACPGSSLPFSPSLTGGVTNINAGAFGQLTTTISRVDGQQALHRVSVTYPPGVSAVLTGVPLCPQAQADAGTCASESLIGESTAGAGIGDDPYTVTGGRVYLTEGFQGAPFGISIVTPAVAGPFNLGNVIVRGKIEINPVTAQVNVTTGEIPTILRGIPLEIKRVNVTINRPHFAINPTSCDPMSITGTVFGDEGASGPVSSPFQLANCQNLRFAPKFTASTAAHTSKQLGASLVTKIEEPAGALGTQADIARVKVQLPKQLPSQLKTLQKACLARTFGASPQACLKESPHAKVGEAVVHTPLLPVPLTGNAYLVSHGGEAFPSLTLVLKGDGVTIVLVGATDITKGITTTTFKTTPDVPFTSFQLALPQGEYSALGSYLATGNKASFCGRSLVMPTEIIAQNGMALYQNTPISVTGCPPAVSVTKTKIKGNSLVVTVKLGQTGTLVLSGKGIPRKTVRGAKAGIRTITIPLTATGRAAARHRAKIKITVALTAAGHTGTATSTVRA